LAYEAHRFHFINRATPPATAVLTSAGAAVIRAGLRAGDVFAAGHFRTVRLFAAKLKPCLWSDVLLLGACHCCVGVAAMATDDFFAETAIPVGVGVVFTVAILLLSVLF
jgi:hypothetical protein